MKNKLLSLLVISAFVLTYRIQAQTLPQSNDDTCLNCHEEEEMLPEDFSKNDIHFEIGLTCAGCHGGDASAEDADEAMSGANGFVGAPEFKDIPEFCGKCHSDIEFMRQYNPRMETDQLKQYYTSVHGKMLKKGDENVAACSSCHTAHSILKASDPRSSVYALNVPQTCNKCHGDEEIASKYGIDQNVHSDYASSVHGTALLVKKDVGAPACNDCHGNHGATPPGVNSISNVCGLCHVNNMNYFKSSSMASAFEEMGYHACEECHGNHAIEKPHDNFVGVGEESVCITCHDEGDDGYIEAEKISSQISSLVELYDSANVKLEEVRSRNMDDVDIEFLLKEINQQLIQARTTVHTFSSSKVAEFTDKGKALAVETLVKEASAIDDSARRRNGFLIATLFFTLFIIGLYLKIKSIDKKKS